MTVVVDGFRVSQGGWLRLSIKSVASDGGISRVELARSVDGAVGSNSTALPQPAHAVAAASAGPILGAGDAAGPQAAAAASAATNATTPAAAAAARVWKVMDNTYGGEWEASALPSPPFDLRVTDLYGRKVVLKSVIQKAGVLGEVSARPLCVHPCLAVCGDRHCEGYAEAIKGAVAVSVSVYTGDTVFADTPLLLSNPAVSRPRPVPAAVQRHRGCLPQHCRTAGRAPPVARHSAIASCRHQSTPVHIHAK